MGKERMQADADISGDERNECPMGCLNSVIPACPGSFLSARVTKRKDSGLARLAGMTDSIASANKPSDRMSGRH
jgi:hypothetical protein